MPGLGRRGGGQHLLEVGLVHQRALRPAVQPGVGVPAELGEHPVPPVEQPEPGDRAGAREQRLGDPGVLEHAEDLVVQVHGAGQRIGLGVPLEDEDVEPPAGEQQRGGQAHGPGADHDHRTARHRPV